MIQILLGSLLLFVCVLAYWQYFTIKEINSLYSKKENIIMNKTMMIYVGVAILLIIIIIFI